MTPCEFIIVEDKEISNEILPVFRENRKMLRKKQLDIKRAQNQAVPTENMQTRNEEDSGEGLRDSRVDQTKRTQ